MWFYTNTYYNKHIFVTADNLFGHFNVFNDQSMFYIDFVDARNPLKMIKVDLIRSES
jgi:hypothetical protein